VDAVIVRDEKILLIKRGEEPFKGYWATPGGYMNWDESLEDAVRRETFEETGLAVTTCRLLNTYSEPSRHPHQSVAVVYVVETTGEPVAGDDAIDFKWVPLDELTDVLAFDQHLIIADFNAERCEGVL
jgi:8-oxo-dGTP diphosphatase